MYINISQSFAVTDVCKIMLRLLFVWEGNGWPITVQVQHKVSKCNCTGPKQTSHCAVVDSTSHSNYLHYP